MFVINFAKYGILNNILVNFLNTTFEVYMLDYNFCYNKEEYYNQDSH